METIPHDRTRDASVGRPAAAVLALLLVVVAALGFSWQPRHTAAAWTDEVVTAGQIEVAPHVVPTDVVSGGGFSCLLAEGQVWCSGDNSVGQLGTGDTASSDVFVGPVGGELDGRVVTTLDAGGSHVCAATGDGGVYCWGSNTKGQLGAGGVETSTVPVRVGSFAGAPVTELELGATGSCAVVAGKGYCWGDTYTAAGSSRTPVQISGGALPALATVTDIGVGEKSACLTADGVPYCWGSNTRGQLGDGTTTDSLVPVRVMTSGVMAGFSITDVSVGQNFACAIGPGPNSGERTFCWGDNSSKQLGQSSNGAQVDKSSTPLQVRGPLSELRAGRVDLGGKTACVLTYTGAAFCWGANESGQTGANIDEWFVPPTWGPERVVTKQMGEDNLFQAVDVDAVHGCGLSAGGGVYCWGSNAKGQLGIEGAAGAGARKVFPWKSTTTWSPWT